VAEKDDYLVDILVDLGFVTDDQVAKFKTPRYGATGLDRVSISTELPKPPQTPGGGYVSSACFGFHSRDYREDLLSIGHQEEIPY